jgi:NAD(P)-dependent dehydrogenase (short-subunit alcohol dehydrogenase family)
MLFDLTGKVALVTGAGQGVGSGIARLIAGQGAHVVVNDLRAERAQQTVTDIIASGGSATVEAFDVTDLEAVKVSFGNVAESLGGVDILVNNAGNGGAEAMRPKAFREMDPSEWEGPIRVNLYGVMNCCHVAINPMCDRGWGRIITIASGAGLTGLNIGVSPYGGGKGGAIGFMRHLAVENARYGVRANTLAIGLMEMPNRSEVTAGLARGVPVGRLGQPEDIGALCVYLASNEAEWMTGQTIQLNGGSVTS